MKKEYIISIGIGMIAGLFVFFGLYGPVSERWMPAPELQVVPVAVDETTEQTLEVAVMRFTHEEADRLIRELEREREAREQAEREREAARRMQVYTPGYFKQAGRISWGGWSWTYYSERILPGYGLRIPGRHTDAQGYVRDGDGYLCLASDVHRKGTILETPFGSYGRVYDCGCGNNYTVDVYVNW